MDPAPRPPRRPDPDVPDPVWPSTEWPAGPVGPPANPHPVLPTAEEKEAARRSDRWTTALTLIGGIVLGIGVTFGVLGALDLLDRGVVSVPRTTLPGAPTTTAQPFLPAESVPSVTEVASAAIPSIVAVSVLDSDGINGGGSGVVYSEDGYLITNHHVVQGANEVGVIFADGVSYPAEVVGSDPLTDIAVISTTRPDLTPIALGSEADLVIGERTVAVGNPLGLLGGPSVTSGILSATDRTLVVEADTPLYGLLQTDAPITRGSSGGALLDQEAKLIGITTAIGITDVGAEGLGFAVPVDVAVGVADDIIADGEVRHAMLGIAGNTVTEEREEATVPIGVGVTEITPESAYQSAGGEMEDVIVSLDGEPVASIQQLIARLRTRRAGDEVVIQALRGDEELTFSVELGEWTR
jgi:S1-C subfamily serine protease